ncbi:unnamed protein product [Bursaphelenchus xylophilus]|uniref:(pine wood nematode) hypothetical protein n=1 Tax=Bursaphelenchus xylophilus TaxID=6326 RepID=A0A1I7STT5_BURXY|nr:unnamed protein product [Bursaphelenchus xylophilus]CAG9107987.1 unnamed protein product [Bursaphelenchus xylophilus]
MSEDYNLWTKCFAWIKERKEKMREERLDINEDIPDVLCNDTQLQLRKRKRGYTRPNIQKKCDIEWTEEEEQTIQKLSTLMNSQFRGKVEVIANKRTTDKVTMDRQKTVERPKNVKETRSNRKVRLYRDPIAISKVDSRIKNSKKSSKRKEVSRNKK